MPKESKQNNVNAELAILYQIVETISYNLDLKEVLSHIIKVVGQVTKADSCFLYLTDGKDLILRASQNPHPHIIGKIRLKIGEGITGWVAKNRKTVVIAEKAFADDRFKFFNNLPEDKYEAFLSVPIIYKEKTLGVINVQHVRSHRYGENEIKLLETIARVTGGAIENARLFTESQLLRESLETRKLVEKAKGILMKETAISEEEAYKILNKKSMDRRMTMKEVANAIIISDELKRG